MIRQPIVSVLGHVDHGKTCLLDAIRGTNVQLKEPGAITQHIGASYIPTETIKKICRKLLEKFKVKIEVPGLLFIDTPGHESFMSLRKRGGSIADLAILVIDINEGCKPQTDESLNLLKQFKVPFVVAATKIDKIKGWKATYQTSLLESLTQQIDMVKNELEKKVYELVYQLAERGWDAERFDRIMDFSKKIAIVPCSGVTKEGVAELLLVLVGLAQIFLKDKLKLEKTGKGNVLEVKEVWGLGTTIDVILYDGMLEKGDWIVIGSREPIVTKVKALLLPRPLQEIRVEKKFVQVDRVIAASGVKIVASNLENVIPGSPFIVCKDEKEIEEAKAKLKAEIEQVEFSEEIDGIILKADTIGSLEAMIKMTRDKNLPIKKAEIGNVKKEDVVECSLVQDERLRVIFAFNVKVSDEIKQLAKENGVEIFANNIIYRIFEEYEEWLKRKEELKAQEELSKVGRPVRVRVLKGCVFRSSKPCIVGVEVLEGKLVPNTLLARGEKIVGKVKEIQSGGRPIPEAKPGEKVAISMDEPIAGRHFKELDELVSYLSNYEIEILKKYADRLSESERQLLEKFTTV
jgi:translation initiation factor 5B